MPEHTGSRPVQITIHADDIPEAVKFYSTFVDAEFNESTSSFVFGAFGTVSFFLLTIEQECLGYPSKGTCFTLLVEDVDATHQRALDAGATEVSPPKDYEWKPRTSIVDDPSGNRVAFSQG